MCLVYMSTRLETCLLPAPVRLWPTHINLCSIIQNYMKMFYPVHLRHQLWDQYRKYFQVSFSKEAYALPCFCFRNIKLSASDQVLQVKCNLRFSGKMYIKLCQTITFSNQSHSFNIINGSCQYFPIIFCYIRIILIRTKYIYVRIWFLPNNEFVIDFKHYLIQI